MKTVALPLLFALLAPATAQQRTAHPQQSFGIGVGNTGPLGFAGGIGAESRAQFLVPRQELPAAPAQLIGIEVAALLAGTLNYQSLGITCAAADRTQLDPVFATNLGAQPTVVLPPIPRSFTYVDQVWTTIPFAQPYQHDGHSDLVIDVRKIVSPFGSSVFVAHRIGSAPERADRPRAAVTAGDFGSGSANAGTAVFTNQPPLSFRLVWQQTPTLRHRSEAGATGNQFSLGGQVELTVQGTPGHFFVLLAGLGWAPGQSLPGALGELRLASGYAFRVGMLDAASLGSHLVAIPNEPSLIGLFVTYQAATVDPATASITLTNGTDHFLNP